jgi:hypothetical protein
MRFPKRKMGKFFLPWDTVMLYPEQTAKVFADMLFLPFRVEFLGMDSTVQFEGMAKAFAPIGDGSVIPEYALEITILEADPEEDMEEGIEWTMKYAGKDIAGGELL